MSIASMPLSSPFILLLVTSLLCVPSFCYDSFDVRDSLTSKYEELSASNVHLHHPTTGRTSRVISVPIIILSSSYQSSNSINIDRLQTHSRNNHLFIACLAQTHVCQSDVNGQGLYRCLVYILTNIPNTSAFTSQHTAGIHLGVIFSIDHYQLSTY
jgi:hypothetical protein